MHSALARGTLSLIPVLAGDARLAVTSITEAELVPLNSFQPEAAVSGCRVRCQDWCVLLMGLCCSSPLAGSSLPPCLPQELALLQRQQRWDAQVAGLELLLCAELPREGRAGMALGLLCPSSRCPKRLYARGQAWGVKYPQVFVGLRGRSRVPLQTWGAREVMSREVCYPPLDAEVSAPPAPAPSTVNHIPPCSRPQPPTRSAPAVPLPPASGREAAPL